MTGWCRVSGGKGARSSPFRLSQLQAEVEPAFGALGPWQALPSRSFLSRLESSLEPSAAPNRSSLVRAVSRKTAHQDWGLKNLQEPKGFFVVVGLLGTKEGKSEMRTGILFERSKDAFAFAFARSTGQTQGWAEGRYPLGSVTWAARSCWASEAVRTKGSVLPALHGKGKASEPGSSNRKTLARVIWWQRRETGMPVGLSVPASVGLEQSELSSPHHHLSHLCPSGLVNCHFSGKCPLTSPDRAARPSPCLL